MESVSALRFASAVRAVSAAARAAGLAVPAFRSPPRRRGARRTIRRLPGGSLVAVVLRGRGYEEVVADLVDGVLAANRIIDPAAAAMRRALLAAVEAQPPTLDPAARVAERQTQAA